MMEIIILFREITRLAKMLDLVCVPHCRNDNSEENYLCVRDESSRDPWGNYLNFEVVGNLINILYMNTRNSEDGVYNPDLSDDYKEQVSIADPKCFDRIHHILEDWATS